MVALNMSMMNSLSILLGSMQMPNGSLELHHDSQMSSSSEGGSPCCPEDKKQHPCDPCCLDPEEIWIDPLEWIPPDDESLKILVGLEWPLRDVPWFLQGFQTLVEEFRSRRKRDAGVTTEGLVDDKQIFINFTVVISDLFSTTTASTTTTTTDRPIVLTEEEVELVANFTKENDLGPIVTLLEEDTTQEQQEASVEGETLLEEKIALDQEIFDLNITLTKGSASQKHQTAFRRNHPKADEMAKLGTIVDGATGSLQTSFELSDKGVLGLQLFPPLPVCFRPIFPGPIRLPCDPTYCYRTIDGTCNNIDHPEHWGVSFTPYRRDLPAVYFGNEFKFRRAVNGDPLPSARLISTIVNNIESEESPIFSILHMTYGQFIDHDLTATPLSRGKYGSSVKCCDSIKIPRECAPIPIPSDDPLYSCYDQTCMEFVRSAPVAPDCIPGPRDQLNQHTAYLDGSVIYGVLEEETDELRAFVDGLLLVKLVEDQWLLPIDPNPEDECNTEEKMSEGKFCFKAGDGRVNEQILLTFFHTLWVREHNRVARILKDCHPDWDDEMLFQEARRIVWAQLQQVTYAEFLPTVIGPTLMSSSTLYPLPGGEMTDDYNPNIDASIANNFGVAAYRFGHSLVSDNLLYVTKQGKVTPKELSTLFFNPFELYRRDGVCDVARGGINLPELKMDSYFTKEITGKLFRGDKPWGLDLVALNIQRGRDHGMAPYTEWRRFCGLGNTESFNDLLTNIPEERVERLMLAYENVNDIDLYAGGVSERPLPGALVGHTFACLIHNQFFRMKYGDRFWFEYKGSPWPFTKDQLSELHRVTLARIMCNNLPDLEYIQRWPLKSPGPDNPKVCCKSIRQYSLDPWKDIIKKDTTKPHFKG